MAQTENITGGASFGERLRQLREAAALTQEQLAERAGLTAKGVSALERSERRHPHPTTVQSLVIALNLDDAAKAALIASIPRRRKNDLAHAPVKSAGASSVSAPPTPLIGRSAELTSITELLTKRTIRLLTLTGPGGVGKTRLALELAMVSYNWFTDGAIFVQLAALSDSALVIPTVAHTLGLSEVSIQTLAEGLQNKNMLLILDNFEHLLPAASAVADLLAACSTIRCLVTSRSSLRLRGEQEYPLAPLAVPAFEHIPLIEEVQMVPAVQLFVQRAQAVAPHFSLTQANTAAVTAICRRLDGLPLAIELAAARLKLLTPTALLARLDRTLPLLVGGARDLPERHRTMRQTIDWSYNLLSAEDQQLFRRLGVFAGSWTLAAAEAICGDADEPDQVLEGLVSLLDKSLISRHTLTDGEDRLYLLKTVRAYALEQLEVAEEAGDIQNRCLDWYLKLADAAEGELYGQSQTSWLNYLEEELDNLRASLSWAFQEQPTGHADQARVERGLRLAGALYRFWQGRGYLVEGCNWLERGLRQIGPEMNPVRAQALNILGWLRLQQGHDAQAVSLLQESAMLYRRLNDQKGLASALDSLGDAAWARGDWPAASVAYEESLTLRRALGQQHEVALSLYSLGRLHLDYERETEAKPLLQEAISLLTGLNDRRGIALARLALGRLKLRQGNTKQALQQIREALVSFRDLVNKVDITECLEAIAMVAQLQGQPKKAVHFWAAAAAVRTAIGVPILSQAEDGLAPLRTVLSEAEFSAAWAEGYCQPLDAAINQALTDIA